MIRLLALSCLVGLSLAINCYVVKYNHFAKHHVGDAVEGADGLQPVERCPGSSEYCIALHYTFEVPKRLTVIWDCDARDVCSQLAKSNPPKDANGTFTDFSTSRIGGITTRHITCCKQNECNYPFADILTPYL